MVSTYISNIESNRNTIRNKLIEIGLANTEDKLNELTTIIGSIINQGAISATVQEGDTYTIPAGYHNGSGTVVAIGESDIFLGEKLYSFGALSDIHLTEDNYNNGVDDFGRALPFIQAKDTVFICASGDIGRYSNEAELQIFSNVLNTYATIPFYTCTGNHDMTHSDAMWENYIGNPRNHVMTYNGDVFIFLSLNITSSTSPHSDNPYSSSISWFKEQLEIYTGARIFVFMHFPPSTYSGLTTGQYYGFTSACTEDDEIITAINKTKNVILFHGHTHYKFQVEDAYNDINIYRFNSSKTALVHIPSCSHPRNANMEAESDLSQGYIVDAYENGVVLRGIDLTTGEYMPEYEYILGIKNSKASANPIICNIVDTRLVAGEVTTAEIYMASGAATVNVSVNNAAITVSPSTFTFTDDNYNIPQILTITANSDLGTYVSSTITLSSNDSIDKTISIALGDAVFTELTAGTFNVTSGDMYNGTYEGVQLEFADSVVYDVTCNNLNITSSYGTILHSNTTNVDVIIRFEGTNSFIGNNKRAMSIESYKATKFIGVGDDASVHLESNYTSAAIKGDINITNLDVVVSATMPIQIVNSGFTIIGNGSLTVNNSKVELLASEHGSLNVNLDEGTPGTSVINITSTPDSGYILSSILINGVDGASTQTMPSTGETITIQGVFIEGEDTADSEVINIPWVENIKIQSSATADSSDSNYMCTQEFIPIESGYSYTISTKTLGTYNLRAMFYSSDSYSSLISTSIDMGVDIFPTQYSYTLIIPEGATYFRLRAKTAGNHQDWRDNLVLTKTKNS